MQENFTKTPNVIFDKHLKELSLSELKTLLVIIRQTIGYIDKTTNKRKVRDRITLSQFSLKTGLSARIISKAINGLLEKKLITVTDENFIPLYYPKQRKGKFFLFYTFTSQTNEKSSEDIGTFMHNPMKKVTYNKRKEDKRNSSKENNAEHVSEILDEIKKKWNI